MVVAIVLITTLGRVAKERHRAIARQGHAPSPWSDGAGPVQNDEVKALRERVQVLERLVTDNHSSHDLDRQIEQLRDR
ncbi:hypothetical protein ASG29_05520 [Sphingomonas sp. Leaf412]|nr:hypothetical protein ASG29_05520 [Sphingomonas sp. Leaf412]